jgi:hypothetical protein
VFRFHSEAADGGLMASIVLLSDGLLSKWGFSDGDAPDTWYDFCDERGIDYNDLAGWHSVLIQLVRRYLLPKLEQDVKVTEISTIHNPIRAETVDGTDVTDGWYDSRATGPTLTPDRVEIPMEEVLRVAQETTANCEKRQG